MKKLLLDTNILLDICINRILFIEDSIRVLKFAQNNNEKCFITTNSITDIYYISKKEIGHLQSINFLKSILKIVDLIAIDKVIILKSLENDITDFEDAIQYFSAIENEIDCIITRNKKDFKNSKIPVLTPKEYCDIFI